MSEVQHTSVPIVLRYDDTQGKVIIVDDREDRFVLSVTEAIRACQIYEQLDLVRFKDQFEKLLNYLGDWLAKHKAQVSKAVLTTRDAGLLFLVCTTEPEFDEEFEEELERLTACIRDRLGDLDGFLTIRRGLINQWHLK